MVLKPHRMFSSSYLVRRFSAFLSCQDAAGSLVDRAEVGSWFPLGVTAGPGGSRAQAEPGRDSPGGRAAGKAARGRGRRSEAGLGHHNQTPFFPVHRTPAPPGCPGKQKKVAPKSSQQARRKHV